MIKAVMKPTLFRNLFAGCLALALTACAAQATPAPALPPALPSATQPPTPTLAPSATPTHMPAPTRTLYSLPTPQPMQWRHTPVLQFDWNGPSELEYARWVDERTFSFESYLGKTYQVSLDLNGAMTLNGPLDDIGTRSYSPHRLFVAECSLSGIDLYRQADHHLVGHTDLTVPLAGEPYLLRCDSSTQWKSDDTALAFTTGPLKENPYDRVGDIYLWKIGQTQPQHLATTSETFGGSMSPDFKHLMYITGWATEANNPGTVEALLVDILEVDSGKVTHLRLKQVGWEAYPGWLTDRVLDIRTGNSTHNYYDSQTGQYLFEFYNSWAGQDVHQFPAASPDQRWVTLDHRLIDNFYAKRYSLYDLQTKTEILLYESPTSRLSFCGWKPDSSRLYLVNSPNQAFTPLDSPLPAGLLAYNPLTRTAAVLVPDAVRAFWSPDMQYAWVIRQTAAGAPVVASLYDAATGKLSGEIFVSEKPVAGDPAMDPLLLDFELRWSHDSTRALLVNARKELFVLSVSGARLLGTGSYRPVAWSPGDRYALVYYARGAWVVDLSR